MKRPMIAGVTITVVLVAVCGLAFAGLKGSKHDFSTDAWEGFDECGACHVPESEKPPAPPLWNTRADLTKRFGRSARSESQPGLGTLVCLQCHDGTIAKDATGAVSGKERFTNRQHSRRFTTGHGRTDHPVGVEYPKIDKGYRSLTSVLSGWRVRLPNGKVECGSCHDPHNDSGEEHMLVMSNARSALCLKCHRK